MKIGRRIKSLRKDNKITLKELSEMTNISISFLSDIENERSNPSIERLEEIAKALNTTIAFLMGEEPVSIDLQLKSLFSDPTLRVAFEDWHSWTEEEKKDLLEFIEFKKSKRNK
ncbi:helix-turn-helix domain-containing protein [Alkaliphilus transvaalensis]|uniref:helix-turn-helix domain-containing protein n=1 Tax=Alkaliphilus transvaalensis TaxID=114628 RepID=UPI00055455E0|nr:helix-turn-helix transcriptional regulator [Alkaliphilus transvaalensis]